MFISYTEDVDDIFARHVLQHHCYADDTHTHIIYVSAPPSQVKSILPRLQHCIADVARCVVWVTATAIKWHENRTYVVRFIIITAQCSLSQSNRTVVVITDVLRPVQSVRDLDVYCDSKLSIQTHVVKVTQTCFFQLRRLRQIPRLLGRDVTANVVAALVLTRLDYCNALLNHCTAAARHQCCYETGVRSSAEGPRHRRHHPAALATDPARGYISSCVSASSPGIESLKASHRGSELTGGRGKSVQRRHSRLRHRSYMPTRAISKLSYYMPHLAWDRL